MRIKITSSNVGLETGREYEVWMMYPTLSGPMGYEYSWVFVVDDGLSHCLWGLEDVEVIDPDVSNFVFTLPISRSATVTLEHKCFAGLPLFRERLFEFEKGAYEEFKAAIAAFQG